MVTISTIGQRRGAGLRAARRRGLDVAVAGASLGGGDSASTGEVTWWKDGLEYVVWLMFIVVLLLSYWFTALLLIFMELYSFFVDFLFICMVFAVFCLSWMMLFFAYHIFCGHCSYFAWNCSQYISYYFLCVVFLAHSKLILYYT
jgi:hypothetical protein